MKLSDSAETWIKRLEGVLVPSLDSKTALPLVRYFADLNVFLYSDEDQWALAPDIQPENLTSVLNDLSHTEEGFAISYFLADPGHLPEIPANNNPDIYQDKVGSSRRSSNLSNLQIVKKMGRQLSSFIELERRLNDHFQGKHVSKKDARILTNFVIGSLKQKEAPRQWEQLSRKRHK